MSTSELSPETISLINRMTGAAANDPGIADEPVDLAGIDPLALGDLWAVACATPQWDDHQRLASTAAETARAVLEFGRNKTEPVFRGAACADYLELLARQVEEKPEDGNVLYGRWHGALFALSRCTDLAFGRIGEAARRLLATTSGADMPHLRVALARLAGADLQAGVLERLTPDLAASPLLVDEVRAASVLDLRTNLALAGSVDRFSTINGPVVSSALSSDPGYLAFAEAGLKQAASRVRRIHDLEVPYGADKAFTLDEADVIIRLVRVALDRDAPWLPPVLDELFRKVSVAPTAAKSLPSQSVATALGYAIEALPTPEAVATLRTVLHDVRHAGIKKKLQRNLRGAERGLAGRPEIALRLPADAPVSKAQLTVLTRCLEAGLVTRMVLGYDDWRARLAEHAQVKALAASLVWRLIDEDGGTIAVLPVVERGRVRLQDVAGTEIAAAAADCRVMLWHPLDATPAEREAWRDRLTALRIRQPFKQVFREHYVVPPAELPEAVTAMFAGHAVSIAPFLGLARREGWRLGYTCLTRPFGPWLATLDLADDVFPGCVGATRIGNLTLSRSAGGKAAPTRLTDVSAVMLSEILRAVDLLVSTSAFALATEDDDVSRRIRLQVLSERGLGAMAEMRRQVLERALRGLEGMEELAFDARHLRLGPYAIHLATGRVTRDGEPVTVELPDRFTSVAAPWLPYDEKLLEMICRTALTIAESASA